MSAPPVSGCAVTHAGSTAKGRRSSSASDECSLSEGEGRRASTAGTCRYSAWRERTARGGSISSSGDESDRPRRDDDRLVTDTLSIGVEEEFLLAHRSAARLEPVSDVVIEAAAQVGVRLFEELTTAQIETNTSACWNTQELRTELARQRSDAAAAARSAGTRLLAAGAPVTDELPPPLTDSPRYQRMGREFGTLATDHGVCACHVHVGLADRETAILVSNHLRLWLPTLLALTANSAIHRGRDTGYASWRTVMWSRWPCAGPPPYFTSADHFDSVVTMLLDSGAMLDSGMIYWDVRPSVHVPTIEIRVSDVPSTVDETVLLAALVRGLVATAVRDLDTRDAARPSAEVLRAAYWRGAHDG